MLLPESMKKLVAVVHTSRKDEILRELKEAGAVEIRASTENEFLEKLDLKKGESSWIRVEASENLSRIENILEALAEVSPDKKKISSLGEFEELIRGIPSNGEEISKTFEEISEKLYFLEERVINLSNSLNNGRKDLEEFENYRSVVERLEKFNIGPKDLRGFRRTIALFGELPREELPLVEKELQERLPAYILESGVLDKKRVAIVLITFAGQEAEVTRLLRLHKFEEIELSLRIIPYSLEEAGRKIDENIEELREEEKKLLQEMQEIASTELENLLRYREFLSATKTIDEVHTKFSRTKQTYVFQGWVPSTRASEVKGLIKDYSGGHGIVEIQEPGEEDDPPTLIKNPKITQPLEVLTTSYGYPGYNEIDPTTLVAITFPLIFGLMFGDIGQGLVLAFLGFLLGFKLDIGGEGGRKLGKTLMLCGSMAFLVGWLYGSLFGLEAVHGQEIGSMGEFLWGFEPDWLPLWENPMEDIFPAVVFSLELGALLITVSLILNVVNHFMHGEYRHALVHPFGVAGLWFFVGAVALLFKEGLNFGALLASGLSIPLIYLPLMLIILGYWKVEKLGLGMSIFETFFEVVLIYISNGLSFVRIMVMGIVHAGLAIMMVQIMSGIMGVDMAGKSLLVAIVFLFGNAFIIAFEAFISFIQDLRLHFYEMFSKFYSGNGAPFKPLRIVFEALEKG